MIVQRCSSGSVEITTFPMPAICAVMMHAWQFYLLRCELFSNRPFAIYYTLYNTTFPLRCTDPKVHMNKKNIHYEQGGSFFYSKGEAHIVHFKYQKKYFNSSELGVLSTTANSNLGSVVTGTVGAVREEQKQDFDQNQDPVPRYS